MQPILSKFESSLETGVAFKFLLVAGLISPLINTQLSFLLVALILIHGFVVKAKIGIYTKIAWVVSGCLLIFYSIYHFNNDFLYGGTRNIKLIIAFPLIFLIYDFTLYQIRKYRIDLYRISMTILIFSISIFAIKYSYIILLNDNLSITKVILGSHRQNNFIILNANHSDDFFAYLAVLGSCSYLLLKSNKILKILALIFVIYLIYMIYNSGSRGGIVGLIVGVSISSVVVFFKEDIYRKIVIMFALGALIFSFLSVGSDVINRIPSFNKVYAYSISLLNQARSPDSPTSITCTAIGGPLNGVDPSAGARLGLYADLLKVWLEKPILGHGTYKPKELFEPRSDQKNCWVFVLAHPHSYYLDILVRCGLLLLIVNLFYIGLIYRSVFASVFREKSSTYRMYIPFSIYVVYSCVQNLFDNSFITVKVLIPFIFSLVLLYAMVSSVRHKQDLN